MAFTREQLLWLIDNKCGGDWRRIHSFLTDNHPPIFLHQYNAPGKKGIEFVDQEIGNGEYITGFYLYGGISIGNRSDDNDRRAEYFLGVSDMMGIGFDTDEMPEYAKISLYAPTWDDDIDPQITATPSDVSIELSWPNATSEYWDFAGYHIYQGVETKPMALVKDNTSYVVEGLKPNTSYSFTVKAVDKRGNASVGLDITVKTTADSTPPVWESDAKLIRTDKTMQSISIKWPTATDNIRVSGYNVYIDSELHVQLPYDRLTYIIGGLTPGTSYDLSVRAVDAEGNESSPLVLTDSTLGDNSNPFWQTGSIIEFSNVENTSITLSWPNASDNVGVDKYLIYIDVNGTSSLLASVDSDILSYIAQDLDPGIEYSFEVIAVDASNNQSVPLTGAQSTPADLSAPEWVSGASLTFTNVTGNSLTVNWPEAVDTVGVSEYRLYEIISGVPSLLATYDSDVLSHNIHSLEYDTEYSYGVVAADADGNESIMLQGTQATNADTTPPEWQDGAALTFTDVSEFTITVNWPEAVDPQGDDVTQYEVFINDSSTPEGVANGTTFSLQITGLELQTQYSFTVIPIDATGNRGIGLTGTQSTTADITRPEWDSNAEVTLSNITMTSITVSWPEAYDNVGVDHYIVYINNASGGFMPVETVDPNTLSYVVSDLEPGTSYRFRIRTQDAAGNAAGSITSEWKSTLEDNEPPVWVDGAQLTFSNVTDSGMTVTIPQATDNIGVSQYRLLMDSGSGYTEVDTTVTGLVPNTAYQFRAIAVDESGNESIALEASQSTTADTTAPVWGSDAVVTLSDMTTTSITANWTPATDNVGVDNYQIYMSISGGSYNLTHQVAGDVTSYVQTGLDPDTQYAFRVRARDAEGNTTSTIHSDTGRTLPDTSQPEWDAGAELSFADITESSITVSWSQATDDIGVTQYRLLMDSGSGYVEVDTFASNVTSHNVTGLTIETSYGFRVVALDAAGNESIGLDGTQSTLADTTNPQWPDGAVLTVSDMTDVSVTLSWPEATDNVGVTGYHVDMSEDGSSYNPVDQVSGDVLTLTITELEPETSYYFRVRPVDGKGLFGDDLVETATTDPSI